MHIRHVETQLLKGCYGVLRHPHSITAIICSVILIPLAWLFSLTLLVITVEQLEEEHSGSAYFVAQDCRIVYQNLSNGGTIISVSYDQLPTLYQSGINYSFLVPPSIIPYNPDAIHDYVLKKSNDGQETVTTRDGWDDGIRWCRYNATEKAVQTATTGISDISEMFACLPGSAVLTPFVYILIWRLVKGSWLRLRHATLQRLRKLARIYPE